MLRAERGARRADARSKQEGPAEPLRCSGSAGPLFAGAVRLKFEALSRGSIDTKRVRIV